MRERRPDKGRELEREGVRDGERGKGRAGKRREESWKEKG